MDENTKIVLLAAIPTLGGILVALINRYAGNSSSVKPVDRTDPRDEE